MIPILQRSKTTNSNRTIHGIAKKWICPAFIIVANFLLSPKWSDAKRWCVMIGVYSSDFPILAR